MTPFKYAARVRIRKTDAAAGLPHVDLEDVAPGGALRFAFSERADREGEVLVAERGDLLLSKLRPYLRKAFVAPERITCSGEFLVLQPTGRYEPRFLAYCVVSPRATAHLVAASYGAKMPRASWSDLARYALPEMDLRSQRQAVARLDEESERMSRLKEVANRFIQEAQALAASRLEEIGRGHTTHRVRHLARLITSGPRGWSDFETDGGPVPFIGIGALSRDTLALREDNVRRISPPEGTREQVRAATMPHDILLSITADLGSVGIVPPHLAGAVVSQHVGLIRADTSLVEPEWLAHTLKSPQVRHAVGASGYGGAKQGLGLREVGNLRVPCPPLEVQRGLARELRAADEAQMKLRVAVSGLATSLAEYRDALIADAVAGEMDLDSNADVSGHVRAMEVASP